MEYFISIFLGTFVLEDAALAAALALVADGKIERLVAFLACFVGICVGDLGLYMMGLILRKAGMENYFQMIRKFRAFLIKDKRSGILTYSIVISRFVPGARLPTYLTAGLLNYPFGRFFALTIVTVFGWVAMAFAVGQSLQFILVNHWILTILSILLFLNIAKSIVPKLSDPWERRALLHSWRRWMSFEFWPASVFYLPVIPFYIFLSAKHRGFLTPFYANPEVENGGLLGESKWDFLKYLDKDSPHTLRTIRIGRQNDFDIALSLLKKEGFSYPFILKPDVGQRGFGVRIIRNDADLAEYLLLAEFEMIVQDLSRLEGEAGVFYVRYPTDKKGTIFSVTDKRFPSVVGDGQTPLGGLILNDRRARIIASTYFSRHRNSLNEIPESGKVILLSECGNHCQGAIFHNGKRLITPVLEAAIEEIASRIPHFYFGRFDIRYRGTDFEVVEVNGAGAEATHIWDARTPLKEAYQTLYKQWSMLFEIGSEVRTKYGRPTNIRLGKFLKECLRVFLRKEPLSVSS